MASVLQEFVNVGVQWAAVAGTPRSLPAPVLVGSRVVVETSIGDGSGSASITGIVDDGGTDYTICKRQTDLTNGTTLEIWSGIATSVNAGQNVVVTQSVTSGSGDDWVGLHEVGNPDPDQVFDATNTNGANTSSVTVHDSGNVTPGTVDSVIIGASRDGSRTWTMDPDFISTLTNNRSTIGYREQAAIAALSYTVQSDIASFAGLIIVAFDSSGVGPSIANVDGDDTITSTQANWPINGSGFDNATVEIRQDSVEIAQTVAPGQTANLITCTTVFDPGAPGNGPHLKYGAAIAAVINADLSEDTQAITVAVPAGRAYVNLETPNTTADNRITAIADLEAGDQLEISDVVGGSISDVTVNPDATFNCAESVVSFSVRCWDADDQTWGAAGIQTPGSSPIGGGGVEGPGVEGPSNVIGTGVVGSLGVTG